MVFVHGCFWHQHPGCGLAAKPGSNVEFWRRKLHANVERDSRVAHDLHSSGWSVAVTWECADDDTLAELVRLIGETYTAIRGERSRPLRVGARRTGTEKSPRS